MPRPIPRDLALYFLATIAAAYVLNQCIRRWWDAPHTPDTPKSPPPQQDKPSPDPNNDPPTHSNLPPLRIHSLPPPPPNGRALPTGSSLGSNPEAMTSSFSLHSSDDFFDDDTASQATTSDADTEPFVDILSPPPTHVITRRRSVRNHDLFAASHISFSELGNLVAPQDESR